MWDLNPSPAQTFLGWTKVQWYRGLISIWTALCLTQRFPANFRILQACFRLPKREGSGLVGSRPLSLGS